MKPLIKYAFAALLLAASTFSYSSTYWEVGGTGVYGTSLDSLCSQHMSGNYVLVSVISTRGKCQQDPYAGLPSVWIYLRSGTCPSPLVDDGAGLCIEAVPNPCEGLADTDTVVSINIPNDILTNETWQTPSVISSGGCLANVGIDSSGVNHKYNSDSCKINPTGVPTDISCPIIATYTGGEATGSEDEVDQQSNLPYTPSEDTTVSTSETVPLPVTTETLPNGDVETNQTTTETKVSDVGAKVSKGVSQTDVKNSTGTTSETVKHTKTVVSPDGSSEETITKNTTVTTPTSDTKTISHNDNSVTNSNNTGDTYTSETTIVNNYDSSGTQTGSTETSSGDAEQNLPDDETKEGNCGAPGQPPCKVELEDNSSDYSSQMSELSSLQSELDALNSDISGNLSDTSEDYGASGIADFNSNSFISKYFSMPNSTCSGAINTTIFGRPFIFDPCLKLAPLRDVLSWVFFILTTMTIIKIVFNRRII